MRVLFVMDPIERLNLRHDSTWMLMREAAERGWATSWCTPDDLSATAGHAQARAQQVTATATGFEQGPWHREPLGAFNVVWMRKDPPFDMAYIFTTYLLELVPKTTLVLNDPAGLRGRNEKIFAFTYTEFSPTTLIAKDIDQIVAFVHAQEKAVLKPWDGNGGRGVLVTAKGDPNLRSMIELLTGDGRHFIIAQQYLPEIRQGDKRIILVDGEPVGAMLRVPASHDHRGNMHAGATVEVTELTETDRAICDRIGPVLREEGFVFVGIDVIGRYLTEINVTSPTGIQEINRFCGVAVQTLIMDAVERRYHALIKASQ